MTFAEFAERYLRYCEIYNAAKTMDGKQRYVRRFVDYFGETALHKIGRADVEAFIISRRPDAGVPTINREIATLKNLFTYAIDCGLIEANPVKGIRLLPEKRKPLQIPTPEEVHRFIVWCANYDALLYDLATLAVNTGLRRGDILKIRGEDVDFGRRVLSVSVSKTGEVLYVPLNEAALRVLRSRKCSGFIFKNGSTHLQSFKRRLKRARKATGLRFRFHDLRHYFAHAVLDAGANIRTVQVLLGHASLKTTERYLNVTEHQRRRAVESLSWAYSYPLFGSNN